MAEKTESKAEGKAEIKKESRIKLKKKKWYPVFAPEFLGEREVGETYLAEAGAALGRTLKVNLRDLTGNIKDQNIYVSLKIRELKGNSFQTEVVGYAYMPFFIRKLVRKGAGKADDSFAVKTRDNKTVRLKPSLLTVFATNRSARSALKKKLREMLKEEAFKLDFVALVNDLLRYKLQAEFKKGLNKICPVREIIMKKVELEKKKAKVKKGREKEYSAENAEKIAPSETPAAPPKEAENEGLVLNAPPAAPARVTGTEEEN